MVVPMYNTKGEEVGEVELRSNIFETPVNVSLMHQAMVRQLANARLGMHKTKSRGEVNRTKSKWYRQKGTGRARHGSRNAPLFVGGGVAHGPKPRRYTKKMPRKMRRAALRSALSVKAMEDQILVLDALEMEAPRTKAMVTVLENLGLDRRVLILLPVQIVQARMARTFARTGEIPPRYWVYGRIWLWFGILATVIPLANLYWMVTKA